MVSFIGIVQIIRTTYGQPKLTKSKNCFQRGGIHLDIAEFRFLQPWDGKGDVTSLRISIDNLPLLIGKRPVCLINPQVPLADQVVVLTRQRTEIERQKAADTELGASRPLSDNWLQHLSYVNFSSFHGSTEHR